MSEERLIHYIEEADKILMRFGATDERFFPSDQLKKICLRYDLHMLQAQLKHLGTDANRKTMERMIGCLREQVEILTETEVIDVDVDSHQVTARDGEGESFTLTAADIIFAVGRAGSRFFTAWCKPQWD